ncbi:MAG: hypothetical protein H6767_09010 [Candidatus Peribacteria bacterium]|nr:MAG: hypothetical protein H6767_09010 [Candidatus Peribacteria bacterium]
MYCSSCETIYSKQDIYGESDKNLLSHTVAEIERILGIGEISCPCCYEQTNHIYDREKYMPEIVSRYRDTEAFLAVFRDEG